MKRPAAILLSWFVLLGSARAAPWEYRLAGGVQLDRTPFGTFDYGVRKGPWSIELLSETVDARYSPSLADGRWWIAVRAELGAAGFFISPWTDGAPDPARALLGFYAGAGGGYLRYLGPYYVGFQASEFGWAFASLPSTTIAVPGPYSLFTLDALVGRYSRELHVWARIGVDVQNADPSPHVLAELTYRPDGFLAPRLELRAGLAERQTEVMKTRLGGLNPYVVPLAGAAWAEFRVEDFVAGRLGLTLRTRRIEVGALLDVAAFDGGILTGFAALLRGTLRRWSAELQFGYAPWIVRQPGVERFSFWLLVGTGWGPFKG